MSSAVKNVKTKSKKIKKSKRQMKDAKVTARNEQRANAQSKRISKLVHDEFQKNVKSLDDLDAYDLGAKLITLINQKIDFKSNNGNSIALDFQTGPYSMLVNAWVDRMLALTPICVSTSGSQQIYPVDLAMFAWMAVILYIRKHGQLNGDLSLIPQFTNDIDIPIPLASVLQYYGKYNKHDQNFVTKWTLPAGFMSATLSQGQLDPSRVYPFPVFDGGLLWDALAIDITISEFAATRTWVAQTVSNWCSTRLFVVSNALKSLGIPVVPMNQVPGEAPGMEAYSCRSANLAITRVFSLVTPIDWEIATIFSLGRNYAVNQVYRSMTIPSNMVTGGMRYATFTIEQTLCAGLMFFLMQQTAFKSGPIKKVYKLYGTPLKTFVYSTKDVFVNANVQFAVAYQQIQQQVLNFNDSLSPTTGFRQFYAMYVLFLLHLHHRCETSSPFTQLSLRITGSIAHSASAYYNQGIADGVALPANIIQFIDSLGVVVSDGAMVIPQMVGPANVAEATWGDPSWAGNLIAMSWKGVNYPSVQGVNFPFPWVGSTTLKPFVDTGSQIWDVAFQTPYLASSPYPIQIPQFTADSFVNIWKATLGQQYYNNLSLAMVRRSNRGRKFFGSNFQMLTIASAGASRRLNIEPVENLVSSSAPVAVDKLGTPTPIPSLFLNVNTAVIVGSSIVLNSAELLQATILPSSSGIVDFASPTSTFACKMTGSNSLAALEELVTSTLQSGQLAEVPKIDHAVKTLPGGELVPFKKPQGQAPSVWNVAVHDASSKLVPPVVGTAATIACDFIPFIGSFISPLCGAGASALATMLTSRSNVTSQTSKSTTDAETSKLNHIHEGIKKFGTVLGAGSRAVDQASVLVKGFARAQVEGLDYSKALIVAKHKHPAM